MTDPTVPPATVPPAGGGTGSNKTVLVVVIVAILTIGCVLIAAIFVFRPKEDVVATTTAAATPGAPTGTAASVRLEPIASATDPFAPPGQVGQGMAVTPVETNGPTTVEGGRVGLYGGTMSSTQCDKNQLTTFLQENPDKGAAWASVIGISPQEIPGYVAKLTPLLLRSDTRVTNHGFVNGQATSLQSVLQAGTAVLVDEKGMPVTKCYCGNPLQPPTPITTTNNTTTTFNNTTTTFNNTTTTYYDNTTTTYGYQPPTYEGPQWPGWNPGSVTIIQVNITIIQVFVVVDDSTGKTFNRPVGSDGSQDTPADGVDVTTTTQRSSSNPQPNPSPNPAPASTTTTTSGPYYPDEPCVDEFNRIVPCGGGYQTTTTYYPPYTTTSKPYYPDEPCVDENNHIVPC